MNVSLLMSFEKKKKKKKPCSTQNKPFTNGPLLWYPIWQQFCVLVETAHLLQASCLTCRKTEPNTLKSQCLLQKHKAKQNPKNNETKKSQHLQSIVRLKNKCK